jgi:general nucleoside transport system ATP-binding protein
LAQTERDADIVVEMRDITKKFGSFTANDGITLAVRRGEVHALLGENGAGKTTLMNQLYGLYPPTSGEILIRGEPVRMTSSHVAISHGIGMVHQHFMLVQPFTVAENIILGRETCSLPGILDLRRAVADVEKLSARYGLTVDPRAAVRDVTVGMQQRVEILKTLYRGADILILDEPTAVLTPQEIEDLITIIRNLAAAGATVIIITHKLKEIKAIADRCTIIRRGKKVDTVDVRDVTEHDLASMMVGREVSFTVDKKPRARGQAVLAVEELRVRDNRGLLAVQGLSLEVHKGEILGLAGVDGNGQRELLEAVTGLRRAEAGRILMNGADITNRPPREVLDAGLSCIPEDRQRRGLVLDYTVAENFILENHDTPPYSNRGILDRASIREHARELIQRFDVRPPDGARKAGALSGGNQQKVIIAREVSGDPDLLIAWQPTRGLDVGAIEYVHQCLVEQRDHDRGVLLVSLELDEIMDLSDRIAVIYEGRIVAVIDAKNAEEKALGLMMAGGTVSDEQ